MRTIFYIVGCLLLLGCQKEDALESKIDYVNLYEITDSPGGFCTASPVRVI